MQAKNKKTIVIVGAGFVGVTLAWYLSRSNQNEIILLDKHHAGLGVTQHAFAWLNVSYGRPDSYSLFRQQALFHWRELDQLTRGALNINWSGAISWQDTDEATQEFIDNHQDHNFNMQGLTRSELKIMEPNLQTLPNIAAFCPDEGSVDPIHATQTLLNLAIEQGVNYLPEHEVLSFIRNGKHILGVKTNHGHFSADQTIITAGVNVTDLLASLDIEIPVSASPCIIVHLNKLETKPIVKHIISTPDMELRTVSASQILCAEDYISEQPEHSVTHIAQNALTTIQNSFIGNNTLSLEKAFIGMRPMPKDQMPIVGNVADFEGLYIISMHAAITLAPLLCHLAQDEILHGTKHAALGPYRLTRFASGN
ncbi:TPA: NAD(P)/FAD-dependent oxidoreductase [Providencia rettgeri]